VKQVALFRLIGLFALNVNSDFLLSIPFLIILSTWLNNVVIYDLRQVKCQNFTYSLLVSPALCVLFVKYEGERRKDGELVTKETRLSSRTKA
jgi:hypothetical protein